MERLQSLFLISVLLAGCGRNDGPAANGTQRPKTQSLAEARHGFQTKLVRKESANQALPRPPAGVFRIVQFNSPIGKLQAYLTFDPKDGKKHPAIIWITGGDCNTLDEQVWAKAPPENDQTAKQYRSAGIVMMFPTLRGGTKNPGFHESFFGELDDIVAAAEFLAKEEYVDPKRIYLGGHSTGGTMVLLAAEYSNRFRAVFSFGPVHDVRGYDAEFHVFDKLDGQEFNLRAPALWLHCIREPVFVFEGTDGNLASLQLMSQTNSNPNVHFFHIEGADHFNILAPTNRLIAEKIVRDDGAACNISFTVEELQKPFAK